MGIYKKYIQFNNLPFDSSNMIETADESGAYKYENIPLTYGNGSYAPLKSSTMFTSEKSVTMTLSINTKKLRCDSHDEYRDFVMHNLHQVGKLWCVVGKSIMWAHAFLVNKGEPFPTNTNKFNIDVEFNLPEGIWHRADAHNLFIVPFDLCSFLDCEDYHTIDQCKTIIKQCCGDCSKDALSVCQTCGCGCSGIDKEYNYCNMKNEVIEQFYKRCGANYRLIYDCVLGNRINGENLGAKICKEDSCRSVIAGQFYSDTILDLNKIQLTIKGYVKNPVININDNTWTIKGEYDGILTITESGTVYFASDECCAASIIENENIIIENGNTFEWNIKHGKNRLIIETNDCCHMACAYIKIDSLVP